MAGGESNADGSFNPNGKSCEDLRPTHASCLCDRENGGKNGRRRMQQRIQMRVGPIYTGAETAIDKGRASSGHFLSAAEQGRFAHTAIIECRGGEMVGIVERTRPDQHPYGVQGMPY